jgi:hypothetical protein
MRDLSSYLRFPGYLLLCFWSTFSVLGQEPPRLAPNFLSLPPGSYTLPFTWTGDSVLGAWEPYRAMLLPVKLAGCPLQLYMQFDTGSPSTLFYAVPLQAIRKAYPKAVRFADTTTTVSDFRFTVGDMPVVAREAQVLPLGSATGSPGGNKPLIIGTLGTDFLDGRVVVIDYSRQQLITGTALPAGFESAAPFSDFMYTARRILVPAAINGQKTVLFFDSGSSAFELLTDKATCEAMALPGTPPVGYPVSSWDRTLTAYSYSVKGHVSFGPQTVPLRQASYIDGVREADVQQMKAFGIGGMIGNKLFLRWAVVLDTKHKKYGLVKSR